MRKILGLVFGLIVVGVGGGVVLADGAEVGGRAPEFAGQDQNGKTVRLGDFAGKIVVLEWLSPDCPFVQRHAERKTMKTLSERYGERGVVWVGVNSSRTSTNATNAEWAKRNELGYPIVNDVETRIGRAFGAKTTPQLFIIDRDGKVAYKGGVDDDPLGDKAEGERVNYVAKALDELLAGKKVSVPETRSYGCGVKYRE